MGLTLYYIYWIMGWTFFIYQPEMEGHSRLEDGIWSRASAMENFRVGILDSISWTWQGIQWQQHWCPEKLMNTWLYEHENCFTHFFLIHEGSPPVFDEAVPVPPRLAPFSQPVVDALVGIVSGSQRLRFHSTWNYPGCNSYPLNLQGDMDFGVGKPWDIMPQNAFRKFPPLSAYFRRCPQNSARNSVHFFCFFCYSHESLWMLWIFQSSGWIKPANRKTTQVLLWWSTKCPQ